MFWCSVLNWSTSVLKISPSPPVKPFQSFRSTFGPVYVLAAVARGRAGGVVVAAAAAGEGQRGRRAESERRGRARAAGIMSSMDHAFSP